MGSRGGMDGYWRRDGWVLEEGWMGTRGGMDGY